MMNDCMFYEFYEPAYVDVSAELIKEDGTTVNVIMRKDVGEDYEAAIIRLYPDAIGYVGGFGQKVFLKKSNDKKGAKKMTIKAELELMKQIEARNEARIKEYMNKLQVASEAR